MKEGTSETKFAKHNLGIIMIIGPILHYTKETLIACFFFFFKDQGTGKGLVKPNTPKLSGDQGLCKFNCETLIKLFIKKKKIKIKTKNKKKTSEIKQFERTSKAKIAKNDFNVSFFATKVELTT